MIVCGALAVVAMVFALSACAAKPRAPTVEEMVDRSRLSPGENTWMDRISAADLASVFPFVVQGVVRAGYLPEMGGAAFTITRDLTGELPPNDIARVNTLLGSYLKMGAGTTPIVVGYLGGKTTPQELGAFFTGGVGIIANDTLVFPRRNGTFERYALARGTNNIFACLTNATTPTQSRNCRTARLRSLGIRTPEQQTTFRRMSRTDPFETLLWLVIARSRTHPPFPTRLCTTSTEPLTQCASEQNLRAESHVGVPTD